MHVRNELAVCDLNPLIVFNAVMQERNVTLPGARAQPMRGDVMGDNDRRRRLIFSQCRRDLRTRLRALQMSCVRAWAHGTRGVDDEPSYSSRDRFGNRCGAACRLHVSACPDIQLLCCALPADGRFRRSAVD
jgi:hypothetical protein